MVNVEKNSCDASVMTSVGTLLTPPTHTSFLKRHPLSRPFLLTHMNLHFYKKKSQAIVIIAFLLQGWHSSFDLAAYFVRFTITTVKQTEVRHSCSLKSDKCICAT